MGHSQSNYVLEKHWFDALDGVQVDPVYDAAATATMMQGLSHLDTDEVPVFPPPMPLVLAALTARQDMECRDLVSAGHHLTLGITMQKDATDSDTAAARMYSKLAVLWALRCVAPAGVLEGVPLHLKPVALRLLQAEVELTAAIRSLGYNDAVQNEALHLVSKAVLLVLAGLV